MKIKIFSMALGINLLMFLSVSAMAQEGKIRIGNLKIIPALTLQEGYDDNIYLGNGNNNTAELEEEDWITHFQPSILFNYDFIGRGGLALGYQGDLAYYDDNDQNDWKTHTAFLNFNYAAPGGLILGLDNTYIDAEDPYGSENEFKLGVPMTERWLDNLMTRIGYDFGNKLRLFGYFNYYKQDYDDIRDYTQNYDNQEFGVGAEVKLLPKTWGFIRYHIGEQDYDTPPAFVNGTLTNATESNDADYDWQRVNTGLTWDSGAKFSGELNFGYKWKDYDNITDKNSRRYDEKDTWIASTQLSYAATPTTMLSLSITRDVRDTYSDTLEYYTDTGIGLSLNQKLFNKFILILGGVYSAMDFNSDREDDNYKANVGLDYQIREWLSAGVNYRYWRKDSNDTSYDFNDNQFMLSLNARY